MTATPPPTVDVRAPNGGRIVLEPVVRMDRLPGISRDMLLVLAVLSAIFLATSVNRLNHTDLWGHLNFGRWIVEHRSLPETDPFRPSAAGDGFLNVPWLGQVLGYGCHGALGLEGLVLGHVVLVTFTSLLLVLAVRGRGATLGWAAVAALAGYVLALPVLGTIRPQLFGMVGLAATLWAMAQLPSRRTPLLWLPLLYAIWANLHGSCAMGLAALGCHAAGLAWEALRAGGGLRAVWTSKPFRRAWIALALATAATCLNPVGPRLLWEIATFGGNGNLADLSEWRPMTIDSLSGWLLLISVVASGALLRWSPRRVWASEVLLFLLFGLLALSAIRMLVWWALIWPWIAAPHAAAAWLLHRRIDRREALEATSGATAAGWRTVLAAACVVTALWWAPPTHAILTGSLRPDEDVLSKDTPQGLAESLQQQGIRGRLGAPMDWADYLVWKTRGAVEPLVYTHVHLASEDVWHDFRRLESGAADWLQIADRHGLDYLAVSPARQARLARRVASEPRCRLVYRDAQAALYRIAAP